ncbi:MAG: GtrA family protein, partial [Candidatus Margulisbacteria bacterium]|nr:GtrA family protein [Candidatus Margulisiibacteriota bacterium]
ITNAYVGYKLFVFKTQGNYLNEYLRFYMVYGAALLFNFFLLPITVEVFKLSPPVAQGIIIWLTILFSYFGHKHFSFSKSVKI